MKHEESVKIDQLTKQLDYDTCVIIVGDAAMAPYELYQLTGDKEFYYRYLFYGSEVNNEGITGWQRLLQLKTRFSRIIWLNPRYLLGISNASSYRLRSANVSNDFRRFRKWHTKAIAKVLN